MLVASIPSLRATSSAASTIASRLSAGLAGRSRRLRGAVSEVMNAVYRLTRTSFVTYSVRNEQCSYLAKGAAAVSATAVLEAPAVAADPSQPPAYRWRWVV